MNLFELLHRPTWGDWTLCGVVEPPGGFLGFSSYIVVLPWINASISQPEPTSRDHLDCAILHLDRPTTWFRWKKSFSAVTAGGRCWQDTSGTGQTVGPLASLAIMQQMAAAAATVELEQDRMARIDVFDSRFRTIIFSLLVLCFFWWWLVPFQWSRLFCVFSALCVFSILCFDP